MHVQNEGSPRVKARSKEQTAPLLKRGTHPNSLLQPQQGSTRNPFENLQGTGRIFQNAALKNLHPFPLDDFHFVRCRMLADSHTQQDTKIESLSPFYCNGQNHSIKKDTRMISRIFCISFYSTNATL